MTTHEPPLSPEVAGARGLRTGWTTGTCASAAAKAATEWLAHGAPPEHVEVALPSGQRVGFPVADVDPAHPHRCAVVKDAGDDPDVTHGAHITAVAAWADAEPRAATHPSAGVHVPATGDVADAGQDGLGADPLGPPATGLPPRLSGRNGPPGALSAASSVPSAACAGSGAGPMPEAEARLEPGTRPAAEERAGGVELRGGDGVGTVTLPGLGLAVGAPAINPVPRRMIAQAVREVTQSPVVITVSVPGGQAMAAKTSNDRLGIVGGISILGTTGVVRPFSTASYRASVVQQVDVAAAQGERHLVLATGSRSDRAAQRLLPELAPVCFVEVGDFTGIALRHAAAADVASAADRAAVANRGAHDEGMAAADSDARGPTNADAGADATGATVEGGAGAGGGIERVTWVGMAGKIAKLAAGVLMTHYRRSKVDGELLAEVAIACAAPDAVVEAATATATARHFAEVCLAHDCHGPLVELCHRAARACEAHVSGGLQVEVVMVDFEGQEVLARA